MSNRLIGSGALASVALLFAPVVVAQTVNATPATEANDQKPLVLQDVNALFVMLGMGEITGDTFRTDFDAYNELYPVPADLNAMMLEDEQQSAARRGACQPASLSAVEVESSSAAPVVRQYIASGEVVNGWLASAKPNGCDGNNDRIVYTVLQKPDGTFHTTRMGRGETMINLNIHYDLSKVFAENLAKFYSLQGATCEDARISAPTMRIVSADADMGAPFYGTRLSGKWREEWTFTGCGGTAVFPIDMAWMGQTNTDYMVQFPEATFTPDAAE